ncbi:hypothetical protein SARC_00656 [Sphaeroforma arctica JP610]|uniref:Uncharacterized protein n=1 Tax=Sphaeroforma arctica JP610 TaxID=667725 RepID=A0A0L0GEA9_9EUKA|nr:hypothetical protein SARC_00656 [Sphaeroforma arctica JP610]KNC87221.1 hypothetical protein SARC_00656 [Sphaeroforma arctica JP610]|eukprot:XP_014161123.1 hypothetical protein SARC_00656 [Sphaeroforma arctica JP610]
MPTATRASVYGDDEEGVGTDGARGGQAQVVAQAGLHQAPGGGRGGGLPILASAMRLEIYKSICQCNHVLVSRFVPKLEETTPVPIATLCKRRVGIHDQQPERRMPIVDTELRRRYDLAVNECGDDEEDELIQISQYLYPALVINLVDSTDATEKTKAVLNELRGTETQITKYFKDSGQFNRIIIDRLRHHPVDYLLEYFLNDIQNKTVYVEVRTERAHKTMDMLEERCRNSDKESINVQILKVQRYQALTYYGQQEKVYALIRVTYRT